MTCRARGFTLCHAVNATLSTEWTDMFRWEQSPDRIEMWIEDADLKAVFGEALMALGDVLTEERGGAPVMKDVSAGAPDRPALLAEWLNELAALAEDEGFVAERVVRMDLADDQIDARIAGQLLTPRHKIKGARCHRLELESSGDPCRAHVVLDV